MIVSVITLITMAAMVVGGMHVANARDLSGDPQPTVSPAISAPDSTPPTVKAASVTDATLAQELNTIIARYPNLEVGVSLVSVADGQTASYGVSDPYVAASVDKLLTATAYLHQVDIGRSTMGQMLEDGHTAQADLQRLIEQSDNGAWTSLNDFLTYRQLKAYAQSNGIDSYDPRTNTIAPEDIAQLLYKLYSGKLLNASSRSLLLSHMKQANYRQYIMAALPSGVTAYHKIGLLDDRVNDAAIIDNGQTAYVLVIFSKAAVGNYDFNQGRQLFHELTTATTKHLLT